MQITIQLKNIIEKIEVEPNSHVTVTFEKDKLSDLLGLYNVIEIIDKIDKDIFTLEFDYYREKKWEKQRRETNEKILKLFSEKSELTNTRVC